MDNQINKHMDLLGLNVRDKVTGFEGVVNSISFDLFGCVQAVVAPKVNEGKIGDSHWFDVSRLQVLSDTPVMDTPDFEKGYIAEGLKGPADKPLK